MSYAGTRLINDADSHLMELPDFLTTHADPDIRAELAPMLASLTGIFYATAHAGRRGHPPRRRAELAALGDNLTCGPKWHEALGAFSGEERGQALNLLGFKRQVIFSSFCARPIFTAPTASLRYGAARAHNRAMAEFCAADARLIGVAIVPLDEPNQAIAEIEQALPFG